MLVCVTLVSLCATIVVGAVVDNFHPVYMWYKLDFTWKDDNEKYDAYNSKQYDVKNNIIQNVKIWNDVAFLTLPRSKSGVPATLVTVPSVPSRSPSASPRLEPFPSWHFQQLANCASLQNVQAIEIDPDGYLWVADSGTTGEFKEYGDLDSKCPPKLLIFNIETRALMSEYEFSKEWLRPGSILTDIVVDPRGNKTAYISVVNDYDASILVYSNQTRSALKVNGLPRVKPTSVAVNGTEVPLKLNKLSLALSVWEDVLYISPSWEETLYSVKVQALKKNDISSAIRPVGILPGLSYAIILDSKNVLYYTILEKDSIGKWNTSKKFEEGHKTIAQDNAILQFPSSFAFDRSENLWVLSNRFQSYLNSDTNLGVPNFRLIRAYTGSDSYMYASQPDSSVQLAVSSLLLFLSVALTILR